MRAFCADCEEFPISARENYVLPMHLSLNHSTIRNLAGWSSRPKIWFVGIFHLLHSLTRFIKQKNPADHETDAETLWVTVDA
jgi:hypothetical protein